MRKTLRFGMVRSRLECPLSYFLTTARARFEASRTVPGAGDVRLSRRHGHGFVVDVLARLGQLAPTHPIESVGYLSHALHAAVAPFDYADLDGLLEDPSDLGIARRVAQAMDGIDIERIVVSPTPTTRLEWDPQGRVISTRRYAFEAAHFLPHVPIGHKCGRLHGHSFEVQIRVRGVLPQSIDQAWAPLGALLEHHCLNDLDGLSNPTSECLAAWLWARLRAQLPTLTSVTVYETGRCGATFNGEQHSIWRAFTFDAAVQLSDVEDTDPRRRTHGHTYRLRLHLSGPLDPVFGWATDFGDVQRLFAPVYDALDHQPLAGVAGLASQATVDVAQWIRQRTESILPSLHRIDLEETPGNGVMLYWTGEDHFPV